MSDARRYLVVGPSWVGDMVMAQSLFISLKQQHPDCVIDVLAPAWSLPVLARMPEVRSGIEDSTQHRELGFGKRWRQGRALRNHNYSHAIVLPRSWKSALVPYFANIPVRTGYKGEQRFVLINDIRRLDKSLLRQTVQRYVALGSGSSVITKVDTPFPVLSVDIDNQARMISKLALKTDRPVVCMMPGAEYGPAKQWPLEYYAELAQRLVESGRRVWVLGSSKDAVFGEVIVGGRDEIHNLCGKTSLVDAIDLLACAEQVVTNDSGLMHVAAATGVKLNAIYGSSTPDYTPPLTQPALKNIFYLGLDCSPCFKRTCPLGHTNCLKNITVETIYADIIK
ncbi:MAG: lipopolysaccharide heptosyltransferase II [Gammaproteobacteria bacterium]